MSLFSKITREIGRVAKQVTRYAPAAASVLPGIGLAFPTSKTLQAALKTTTAVASALSPSAAMFMPGQGAMGAAGGFLPAPVIYGGAAAAAAGAVAAGRKYLPGMFTTSPASALSEYVMAPRKRYRRMNPLNPKALRRASRRICSARNQWHHIEKAMSAARSRSSKCR